MMKLSVLNSVKVFLSIDDIALTKHYLVAFTCINTRYFLCNFTGRMCRFHQSEHDCIVYDPRPTRCLQSADRTTHTIHVSLQERKKSGLFIIIIIIQVSPLTINQYRQFYQYIYFFSVPNCFPINSYIKENYVYKTDL